MESISKGGSEAIRTASRVRQWAVLGSKANIAQFGFQRYLRTGGTDPTTVKYLGEGRDLFELLKEGEEATTNGITSAHQLAAVNALEPIQRPDGKDVLTSEEIRNVVEAIEAILRGERLEKTEVENALENALKASDAYTDFAFKEIDIKEKEYTRRGAVRV